ncbi:MAG TPA: hypothetical protein PKC23_04350 [Candidatus Desulfobacillus sp.]|nr:hypothetical protein [Candidatus Desulfobacillus sp.]
MGSLLLSLAVHGRGDLIGRDGILYVETARAFLELGPWLPHPGFDWQFFPLLMAGLSALTGLELETAGHLLNAFLLAGACVLAVAMVRQRMPEAAWLACLVALAMPGYNGYRGDLIREHGFWCFSLLAIWLAMRWSASVRWREALACQLALGVAALFRLEAAAFYPALMLWAGLAAPAGQRLRRTFMIGCLPVTGGLLAGIVFGSGLAPLPSRISAYLDAANPLNKLRLFKEAGDRMQEHVLPYKYSREEAGYILFFGLLSMIPVKFLKMTGVFLVPLAYLFAARPLRAVLSRWQPLAWAFAAYLLVLAAFITHMLFISARYVSMLSLLAVPFVSAGFWLLLRRWPRWKSLMLALAVLTLAANVVPFSPRKTHIVEAGRWLGANVANQRVCLANPRIAYYAGWRIDDNVAEESALDGMIAGNRCDWLALEAGRLESLQAWLVARQFGEVRRFENVAGDAVVIARRMDAPPLPPAR